ASPVFDFASDRRIILRASGYHDEAPGGIAGLQASFDYAPGPMLPGHCGRAGFAGNAAAILLRRTV
ncbi:MAG TPA: hypothetical protein VF104_01810, partial [Burkholderiales bacterium]